MVCASCTLHATRFTARARNHATLRYAKYATLHLMMHTHHKRNRRLGAVVLVNLVLLFVFGIRIRIRIHIHRRPLVWVLQRHGRVGRFGHFNVAVAVGAISVAVIGAVIVVVAFFFVARLFAHWAAGRWCGRGLLRLRGRL